MQVQSNVVQLHTDDGPRTHLHPKSGAKIFGTKLGRNDTIQKGDFYSGLKGDWVPVPIHNAKLCDTTDAVWIRPFAQTKK